MPRLGANKGRRGAVGVLEADIRLTDYAHAALPSAESSRVSKKAVSSATKLVRETRHWWECEEEDFVEDFPFSAAGRQLDEAEEESEDEASNVQEKDHRKTLVPLTSTICDKQRDCARYPIDLWFLVSDYVPPEDVGRFALICRCSYSVTRSSAFWRRLYQQYFDPKALNNIQEQFRPMALRRPYGLRTRVIKALHCCYGRFLERTRGASGVSLSEAAVEKLYRGVCESTWWEHQRDSPNGKAVWRFYFKFRSRCLSSSKYLNGKACTRRLPGRSNSSLDYLDDTWANLEDGCCILKVTCGQYTQIPMVLGWRLSELVISLCSDMRSHRLRLGFSETGGSKSAASKVIGAKEVSVLESVQSMVVYDWWHPSYPLAVL